MRPSMWWCQSAWLGGEQPVADVLIETSGGVITAVKSGVPAPPGAITFMGLTIPGLANAHSHAFHRGLRGRTHSGGGTFWTWREEMYALAATLDPDSYFRLARATFAEMVLAGVTCVGEFHYLHHQPDGSPYADPNAIGRALISAAGEAGLRITLLDTCYLQGGPGVALEPVQRRYRDGSAEGWIERVERLTSSDLARIGAAIHSVRAVDPASIERVADWADQHDCPLHAHVSEQPIENEQSHAAYGGSPVAVLARHGALSDRFSAVHATHVDDADVTLLAGAGSVVCLCPTTERDLADGIAPTAAFRSAGIGITLGSDSNAVIDLFEEARAVELDERLATGQRGNHPPGSLLAAATDTGHRSLGWPEAGRIEVGALADFVHIGLSSVRLAGTQPGQAIAAAVFAATAADVTDVVVGGEHVVRAGRHRSLDVAAELEATVGSARQ